MKTKKNRREMSKKRQEMARQKTVWEQKIKDLETKFKTEPNSGAAEQLLMCRVEYDRCLSCLRRLNTRQRAWVSGKLGL
jgi:hypothetical protein